MVFDTIKDKNNVATMTSIQQVSILFLRRKKKISSISNTSSAKEKLITLANIPQKKSEKTSIGLDNLYASVCS